VVDVYAFTANTLLMQRL